MLKRLTSERQMKFFCFLCCLIYFASYLTRLNYAACLIEIQQSIMIEKSMASLPVMGGFITYGVGQIICGFWGDRFLPQKMIFVGLTGSAACNFIITFFPKIEWIIPMWCLNGFFQSMLWPPLVRIMAEALNEKWYKHCCVLVSFASAAGTFLIYVSAPLCIRILGWRYVFFIPAILGSIVAIFWIVHTRKIRPGSSEQTSELSKNNADPVKLSKIFVTAPLVVILVAIIFMGILRDGITTWMPTYMTETFKMSTSLSILVTAILPIFSIFSTVFTSALHHKLKNEIEIAALMFGAAAVSCFIMLPVHNKMPILSIMMMMMVTGCMYGANLMLISRVPIYFAKFGKISSVSGILNAATYIGSALATYGFGAVAERFGWLAVVAIWAGVSICGALFLFTSSNRWLRFCKNE